MTEPRLEEKTNIQSNIGATLRKRREELGWNEQNIADHLRIRVELLYALEQGKYEVLPGQAYAIGFLKNYAALLGLDSERIVLIFKRELSGSSYENDTAPQLDFPQAARERSLPKWLLIVIGLAVVLVAYVGWYHFSSHDDVAQKNNSSLMVNNGDEEGSDLADEADSNSESEDNDGQLAESETLSIHGDNAEQSAKQQFVEGTSVNQPGQGQPDFAQNIDKQNSVLQDRDGHGLMGLNNNPEDNTQQHNGASQNLTSPPALQNSLQKKSPFEAAVAPVLPAKANTTDSKSNLAVLPPHAIEVHFTQDSWTKISDHSGKVIDARTFKAGETWTGDGSKAPYTMTAGNAAGVIIRAGNVISAPLGKTGEVKRNVSISADDVIAGRFGHADLPVNVPVSPVKTDNVLPSEPKNLEQIEQTH